MSNENPQKTFHSSLEENQPEPVSSLLQKVPRARNAEQTRAALFTAARLHFARDGYEATNLRDIANDAQVNVALIPRYFGSKEGLFQAVVAFNRDRIAAVVQGPSEQLGERLLHLVLDDDDLLVTLLRSSSHLPAAESLRTWLGALATDLTHLSYAPDVELRADLVVALLVGVATLRRLAGITPLSTASAEMLLPSMRDVISALLSPPETSNRP